MPPSHPRTSWGSRYASTTSGVTPSLRYQARDRPLSQKRRLRTLPRSATTSRGPAASSARRVRDATAANPTAATTRTTLLRMLPMLCMMVLAVLERNSAAEAAARCAAAPSPAATAAHSRPCSCVASCRPSRSATIAGATSTSAAIPSGRAIASAAAHAAPSEWPIRMRPPDIPFPPLLPLPTESASLLPFWGPLTPLWLAVLLL
mmetsp:Transcript_4383/g.12648  ORF Transcript_4383/g.12648 Transcript_4383/m.12648 type:complete len:205 (-) Transcript_4383:86-700(-)